MQKGASLRELIRQLANPYLDFSDCANLNDVTRRIDRRIRALLREAWEEERWAREAFRKLRALDPDSREYREYAAAAESRLRAIRAAEEARHAEMFALIRIKIRISGAPQIDPSRSGWAN